MKDVSLVDKLSHSTPSESEEEDDGDRSSTSSSYPTSAYNEMIAEVEKLSEELLQTQEKLWRTEDELEKVQDRNKMLEKENFGMQGNASRQQYLEEKNQKLDQEVAFLKEELVKRDQYPGRPEAERRLKKALEIVQKDLEKARAKTRKSETAYEELEKRVKSLDLDNLKKQLETSERSSAKTRQELESRESELAEAREENAKLVEEVALLRDELRDSRQFDKRKEEDMKKIITDKVKEKLTKEVQEETEQILTQKLTRQLKVSLKADKDKEIDALREQFKKVFKENEGLKERVKSLEGIEARNEILEDQVPKLKYEISRLVETLDKTKIDQEHAVNELESIFRKKLQDAQEQNAKEKWAHAAEIRQQLSKERQQESNDYSRRLEALSKETEELLEKAAREKEMYGNEIKARVAMEKDIEIKSLKVRMGKIIQESKDLLQKANLEKETYTRKMKKKIQTEKADEISRHIDQVNHLSHDNDRLQKKLAECERKLVSMESAQLSLKEAKEELIQLRNHSSYLTNLAERYKNELDRLLTEKEESGDHTEEELYGEDSNINRRLECFGSLEADILVKTFEKFQQFSSDTMVGIEEEIQKLDGSRSNVTNIIKEWKEQHAKSCKVIEESRSKHDLTADDQPCHEIEGLRDENDGSSASQIEELKDAHSAVLESNEELRARIEELEHENGAKLHSDTDLLNQIERLHTMLRDTCTSFLMPATEKGDIGADVLHETKKLTALLESFITNDDEKSQSVKSGHDKVYGDLVSSREELQSLDDEIKTLCSLLTEESEVDNHFSDESQGVIISNLKKKILGLSTLLSRAQQRHNEMIDDLDNYYNDNCRLESKVIMLSHEKLAMQNTIGLLREKIFRHRDEHQLQIEELRRELDRSTKNLNKSKADASMTRNELHEIHSKYMGLIKTSKIESQKYEERIEELESTLMDSKQNLSGAVEECENLTRQLFSIKNEAKSEKEEFHKKIQHFELLLQESSQRCAVLERELENAGIMLSNSKMNYDETIDSFTEQIAFLKRSLEESNSINAQLSHDLKITTSELSKIDDKNSHMSFQFNDEIGRLKQIIRDASIEKSKLMNQIETLKRENKIMNDVTEPLLDEVSEDTRFSYNTPTADEDTEDGSGEDSSLPTSSSEFRQEKQELLWKEETQRMIDEYESRQSQQGSSKGTLLLKGSSAISQRKKRVTWKERIDEYEGSLPKESDSISESSSSIGKGILKSWNKQPTTEAIVVEWSAQRTGYPSSPSGNDEESVMDETIASMISMASLSTGDKRSPEKVSEATEFKDAIKQGTLSDLASHRGQDLTLNMSEETIDDEFLLSRMKSWEEALDDFSSSLYSGHSHENDGDLNLLTTNDGTRIAEEDDTIVSETTSPNQVLTPCKDQKSDDQLSSDSASKIYTIPEEDTKKEDTSMHDLEECREEEPCDPRETEEEISWDDMRATSILSSGDSEDDDMSDALDTVLDDILTSDLVKSTLDGFSETEKATKPKPRPNASEDAEMANEIAKTTLGTQQDKPIAVLSSENDQEWILKSRTGNARHQSRRQLTIQDMRRRRYRKSPKKSEDPNKEGRDDVACTESNSRVAANKGDCSYPDLENWSLVSSEKSASTTTGLLQDNDGESSHSDEAQMLLLVGSTE